MRAFVLSGGAAFGAYQAGAWSEIERTGWRPDIVTGISIGAVNGWAVSRAATGDDLRRMWLDWPAELEAETPAAAFALPWQRHAPLFLAWLDRIVAERGERPPICAMTAVLLEVPSFRFLRVSGDDVDVATLRAACALPGVLPAGRVDGSYTIDSGAMRHIPLYEALQAGADEIIVVDLLNKHPVPPARLARRASLAVRDAWLGEKTEPTATELEQVDIRWIRHPHVLGSLLSSFRWSRAEAQRLFEAGQADARAALDR